MKNDKIEKLKKSPIFNMSLGSKELFHSNFWAWLMEQNNEFIKVFFPELYNGSNKFDIEREKNNIDITIKEKGSKDGYFIENKMKSMPDEKQLIKYSKHKDFKKGVITGIFAPTFEIPKGWTFLSYAEIANGLREIELSNKDNQKVLKDYLCVLDCIQEVIKEKMQQSEHDYLPKSDEFLKELRIDDLFQKLKAGALACEIEQALDKGVTVHTDMTRATALVNIFIPNSDGSRKIGVQIQGNRYKLFATGYGTTNGVFTKYKKMGWFEDYNKDKKTISGKPSGMREEFCKYEAKDANKHHFIYQWWKIDESKITKSELIKLIKSDMKKARKIAEA